MKVKSITISTKNGDVKVTHVGGTYVIVDMPKGWRHQTCGPFDLAQTDMPRSVALWLLELDEMSHSGVNVASDQGLLQNLIMLVANTKHP